MVDGSKLYIKDLNYNNYPEKSRMYVYYILLEIVIFTLSNIYYFIGFSLICFKLMKNGQ